MFIECGSLQMYLLQLFFHIFAFLGTFNIYTQHFGI